MLTGTHQQIGIAVNIMYLEKELRLALVILQNRDVYKRQSNIRILNL